MTAQEIQNRYVLLGNEIARLSGEAAALEVAMSEGSHCPMSLQVYDNLKASHAAVRLCLHTLAKETGVTVEVV